MIQPLYLEYGTKILAITSPLDIPPGSIPVYGIEFLLEPRRSYHFVTAESL